MLKFLENWKWRGVQASRVPDGLRVYAIGDVHGCKSQMVQLLEAIKCHQAGYAGTTQLVFLGDLVDRGPDSSGVLEYLLTTDLPADEVTFIMGNHEEFMLDCYDGNVRSYSRWLQFGGIETMESYGVSAKEISSDNCDLSAAMKRSVPPTHIAFLRSFQNTLRLGDFLFVHAGIRPGTPLEDQSPSDLRWIASEFLTDKRNHGFTVVHGHTIVPEVARYRNRIGVDTGCYRTGVLSALVLEGAEATTLVTVHPA
jgi:serine/threonine protein phosphatase 1